MSARNNAKKRDKKERTKKNGSEEREKPSTPIQAIDAHMGEEEKNRKQKEEHKKETGNGSPTHLPGPFDRLLLPAWIILWSYSEIRLYLVKV